MRLYPKLCLTFSRPRAGADRLPLCRLFGIASYR